MTLGWKRDITAEDLYQVLPEDESEELGRQLELFRFFYKWCICDYVIIFLYKDSIRVRESRNKNNLIHLLAFFNFL